MAISVRLVTWPQFLQWHITTLALLSSRLPKQKTFRERISPSRRLFELNACWDRKSFSVAFDRFPVASGRKRKETRTRFELTSIQLRNERITNRVIFTLSYILCAPPTGDVEQSKPKQNSDRTDSHRFCKGKP